MANRPISIKEANDMIQLYLSYMTGLGVDMNKQTQSVSFTPELLSWMKTIDTKDYDEWRVCFGVYPSLDSQKGRMTVILWPYKDGKPANKPDAGKSGGGGSGYNPFNQGQGNP